MLYRLFGSTGLPVSVLGFGGMRFADQDNRDACTELVRAAYEAGVNYFDTAPGYGKSEELFGEAFKTMLPSRQDSPFYVATKTFKQEPDDIRRELETSLARMGLSYIDFYHVWCVMNWGDYETRRTKGAMRTFERLRDEGLIRHLSVSTHMPGADIGRMLRDYPFESVLMGYSAMNFAYRDEGLAVAHALERGTVVMNPLGGGIIPQYPERFSFLAQSPRESVVENALRFLYADERINVVLVGLSDLKQLAEAVSATEAVEPFSEARIASIREQLKEAFDAMCTGCRYCDHCPEGLPVPRYMDAYNHLLLTGKAEGMVSRLRWHWGIKPEEDDLARCTACGACEEACTQHLPILARFETMRQESARVMDAEKQAKTS